jgi:hypothetical protein
MNAQAFAWNANSPADIAPLVLDRLTACDIAGQWAKEGTRYAVIDNLLPHELAMDIYESFPKGGEGFDLRNSFRERKRTTYDLDRYPVLKDAAYALQDPRIVALIDAATGMSGLEIDPSLYAGGPSEMVQGDFLNPHIDNSHDGGRKRYRRLNLLYYLTPDWKVQNGGNLELWDTRVRKAVTIPALFNRLVLMETNRTSWHSVSPVVVDRARCCISSYYFSKGSPDGSDYYHVTSFNGRPGETLKRLIAPFDNASRDFARKVLDLRRKTDAGYEAAAH